VPPGTRETVQAIAEIAPNTDVARSHPSRPGDGLRARRQLTLTVGSEPPKDYKGRDSFFTFRRKRRTRRRAGRTAPKVLATYIRREGQAALATPAP